MKQIKRAVSSDLTPIKNSLEVRTDATDNIEINAMCEYFLTIKAFLGVVSSPNALIGDPKIVDSRLKRAGMTKLAHGVRN